MWPRALIVLLLVLNVGVATWWVARKPPPAPVIGQPAGIARLRLASEAPTQAGAPAPTPVVPIQATAIPAAAQCFSIGPFVDAASAAAARARLQAGVLRIAPREQPATPARGWRVQVPPQASPEAAQAMAQRIAAAGFSDLLVVRDGAEANAIALGRFDAQDAASRHAAALVAAGFPARAEPLGDPRRTTWLDIVAAAGFDAATAQATAAATQRRSLDCAQLR